MSDKQAAILAFIIEYLDKHGDPPTLRAIAVKFGYRTESTPGYHISHLQAVGYLTRRKRNSHAYQVTRKGRLAIAKHMAPRPQPIANPQPGCCIICGVETVAQDYCAMHYMRWRQWGDPLIVRGKRVEA